MIDITTINKKPILELTNEELDWLLDDGWNSTSEVQEEKIDEAIALLPKKLWNRLNTNEKNLDHITIHTLLSSLDYYDFGITDKKPKTYLDILKYAFRVLGGNKLNIYYALLFKVITKRGVLEDDKPFPFKHIKTYEPDVLDGINLIASLKEIAPGLYYESIKSFNDNYSTYADESEYVIDGQVFKTEIDHDDRVIVFDVINALLLKAQNILKNDEEIKKTKNPTIK